MHSVRSVPISSKKRPFPRAVPVPSAYSPSEHSPLQSQVKGGHWRSSLHPEIEEQYNRIIRGETLRCSPQEKPQPNAESTRKSDSLGGEARRDYEDRIRQLEEQNHSLRDELYYLREALLINFSQRAETK